ncbi:hypothetical protein [Actinokineospora cianjurensis]|nr:hypothetical protein [Actinokineospora cianjurensis]
MTRLTYEIAEGENGVCSLTLTHDVEGGHRFVLLSGNPFAR